MEQRHHRLAYTGVAAAVVVAIGLLALNFPVFLDEFDRWGFQINCGTGYVSELTQAASAGGDKNYVDGCESALLMRRLWAVPLVVLGGAVILAVVVASAMASARESVTAHSDTA